MAFIAREQSYDIYISKMISEIVATEFPEIQNLLRKITSDELERRKGSPNAILEYLSEKGISEDVLRRFNSKYSEMLLKMDANLLLYDYFQLDYIQDKVREEASRFNSSIRRFTKGRPMNDEEWSFISSLLGDWIRTRRYKSIPEVQQVHRLFGKALEFCLKSTDLTKTDFAKVGLNMELGDSTITLAYNQREMLDFRSLDQDLDNFSDIAVKIFNASRHLWKHNKRGAIGEVVFYDLVSRHKENSLLELRESLVQKLKEKAKGRTSLTPNIEFSRSNIIKGEIITIDIQKILDSKVKDREKALQPFDLLLTRGTKNSQDLYEAWRSHYEFANSTIDKDGRLIYKNQSFTSKKVDDAFIAVVEGFIALKELIDHCKRTGINFMRIPTEAFRKLSIAKKYSSLNKYILEIESFMQIEQTKSNLEEVPSLVSNLVLSENMLEIKDKLKLFKPSDLLGAEGEEFRDLTFVRNFLTMGDVSGEPPAALKLMNEVSFYEGVNKMIWDKLLVPKEIIGQERGYLYKLDKGGPEVIAKTIWSKVAANNEISVASDPDLVFRRYFVIFPKAFLSGEKHLDAYFFTFYRITSLMSSIYPRLREFLVKVCDIPSDLDQPVRLVNENSIFRMFHEVNGIRDLVQTLTTFEDRDKLITKLVPDRFYCTTLEDIEVDDSLHRALSYYIGRNEKIFSFIRYLHKVYVERLTNSFSEITMKPYVVDEEELTRVSTEIYNSPVVDPSEHDYFRYLRENSTIDDNGILINPKTLKPYTVRNSRGYIIYIHEHGYLLHILGKSIHVTAITGKETLDVS